MEDYHEDKQSFSFMYKKNLIYVYQVVCTMQFFRIPWQLKYPVTRYDLSPSEFMLDPNFFFISVFNNSKN